MRVVVLAAFMPLLLVPACSSRPSRCDQAKAATKSYGSAYASASAVQKSLAAANAPVLDAYNSTVASINAAEPPLTHSYDPSCYELPAGTAQQQCIVSETHIPPIPSYPPLPTLLDVSPEPQAVMSNRAELDEQVVLDDPSCFSPDEVAKVHEAHD